MNAFLKCERLEKGKRMLYVAEQEEKGVYVRYAGRDDKDLKTFYSFVHSLPKDKVTFQRWGYIIPHDAFYELEKTVRFKLKFDLFDYQQQAVKFILIHFSALILLPCGAGKSFIMIAAYAMARQKNKISGSGLIIVKASLKKQWEEEIRKFSHLTPCVPQTKSQLCGYLITKLKKTKDKKECALIEAEIQERFEAQFKNIDLFVVNYETLLDDDMRTMFHKLKIQFVASDESHYIKNYKAKRTQSVYEFSDAVIKIGSTATPIQKDYCDAFGIFKFLVPELYKSFSQFAGQHIQYAGFGQIAGFRNVDRLMNRIKPYLFIKTEDEIASQLPTLMPPIQYWCTLDPAVQEMSDLIIQDLAMLKDKAKALIASFRTQKEYEESPERIQLDGQIMGLQTFAQEIINAPELLELTHSNMAKKYVIQKKYKNTKLELLVERVEEILDSGEKVCIFSKYERIQSILEERLLKIEKGLKIAKVHGGLDSDQRYEEVYVKFKTDPQCKILLGSNAMAEGINLSMCKYLIEYDLAESYAIQTQRHGRIRRADNKNRTVYVYQILAHDSWDDIAVKIVSKKELMDAQLKN